MDTSTTTTARSLHHPTHEHPLVKLDLSLETIAFIPNCDLCEREIWTKAYTCQERCPFFFYHKACAEAPPQIDRHPLHPIHPLTLIHGRATYKCDACDKDFYSGSSSFRCDECELDLDICCALSTLSDRGSSQGGETPEEITLPLHPHPLTSFSTRHDFVGDGDCYICRGSVEGDGYMCLRCGRGFIIHKRCIQDLHYADGTKAPRVYHGHPLETFVGEDTCSTRCARCKSNKSGEFIGCACCQVFYHRHCFQVPEILQYPSHNPDHPLVLFPDIGTKRQCQSCLNILKHEMYYRCTSCKFFVHIGCAFQVLVYCEEGMSPKIELSWHKHLLLLCHRAKPIFNSCSCCEDEFNGPAYACGQKGCKLVLHKQCTELVPKIDHHPHHPEHPLALLAQVPANFKECAACCSIIEGFSFSCEFCEFYLHTKCVSRFPTRKHYLHEHDLVQFDEISSVECNRCRTANNSPIFRCVPCNFNLHEKCMELPLVVKHNTHFHPLILREFFREDDTGEYYCDLCEQRRDGRLGVYVCGDCELKMDRPWAFHIECILPELRKMYENANTANTAAIDGIANEILRRGEELREAEEKVEKMKRTLEGLRNKQAAMILK